MTNAKSRVSIFFWGILIMLIVMLIGIYILEFWGGLPSMLFHLRMKMTPFYGRRPKLNENETSVLSKLILWALSKINN